MKTTKWVQGLTAGIALLACSTVATEVYAKPRVAVLAFELKDVTLAPGIPAEIKRTAAIRPALEAELNKAGYEWVDISASAQQHAAAGEGYLFDHADAAAELGKQYGVDYVLVGRLHKPSFLFFYLLARLVDVHKGSFAGDYVYEVKGGEKKLVANGVAELTEKITHTLANSPY